MSFFGPSGPGEPAAAKKASDAPPGGPKAIPGKGIKGAAKANPQLAIGGAAVAVVILVALMSKKGAEDTTGETITPGAAGTYDSTANDVYSSLMETMGRVQEQVNLLNVKPATPIVAVTPKAPAVVQNTAAWRARKAAQIAAGTGGVVNTAAWRQRKAAQVTAGTGGVVNTAAWRKRKAAQVAAGKGVVQNSLAWRQRKTAQIAAGKGAVVNTAAWRARDAANKKAAAKK